MALTDISIRGAKPKDKAYKLSDAAGLYLLVKPNGAKYRRLKYRIAGKAFSVSSTLYLVSQSISLVLAYFVANFTNFSGKSISFLRAHRTNSIGEKDSPISPYLIDS